MAVGKLNVTPVTVRGVPVSNDARLFVGCYIQENEKHRTHTENGSEPCWKNSLNCNVTEGNNFLHVELVNESSTNGGIIATTKIPLNSVYQQGTESKWVQLHSSSGQSMGEVKLDLSFSGTNSVSSVTSSFGGMNLASGEHVSYKQTTSHSQSISHQSDSRQSSYSSLGPANPIPSNYGSGSPPPFTPQAAVSYPEHTGNPTMPGHGMPGSGIPTGGLVDGRKIENLNKEEFEAAKEKGAIPSWMKYGGGVLAGAAALGLTAWGAKELKERYDEKNEEDERLKNEKKPLIPQGNLPYKIENQGGQQQHQQQQQQPQQPKVQEQHHYSVPPVQQQQQQHFSTEKKEKHEKKDEHKSDKKEHKKEKKEKKDKKDKKHKKHGSGSDSSSSDSDSDSSDDERKGKKKDKKKRDSDWK
ncbi:hypothetical protein BD770DRAFT_470242 [Pilaira anomala]|nr:hypothetical protein BD770DRAFT_470242 [Pilaira anomala]